MGRLAAAVPVPSGSCTWTYHEDPTYQGGGYWTVVDQCTSGHCSTGLAKVDAPDVKVDKNQFKTDTYAEYAKKGKTPPNPSKLTSPTDGVDYIMECV